MTRFVKFQMLLLLLSLGGRSWSQVQADEDSLRLVLKKETSSLKDIKEGNLLFAEHLVQCNSEQAETYANRINNN